METQEDMTPPQGTPRPHPFLVVLLELVTESTAHYLGGKTYGMTAANMADAVAVVVSLASELRDIYLAEIGDADPESNPFGSALDR